MGAVFICGGDVCPGPRGDCPNEVHDYPLPEGYTDAHTVAQRRLRKRWTNKRCPECGLYGWIPGQPLGDASDTRVPAVLNWPATTWGEMSSDLRRRLAQEYQKDHGDCLYCAGRHFTGPGRWFQHLRKMHPDTVRTRILFDHLTTPTAAERVVARLDALSQEQHAEGIKAARERARTKRAARMAVAEAAATRIRTSINR